MELKTILIILAALSGAAVIFFLIKNFMNKDAEREDKWAEYDQRNRKDKQ